jgi:hypothetical protein
LRSPRAFLKSVRFYLPFVFPKLFQVAPKGDTPRPIAFATASSASA